MTAKLTRRTALHGMIGGAAISVALPFLDIFLDGHGEALASGRPLPVRFGTWFWGLGVTPGRWIPTAAGSDYEILPEFKYLEKFRREINILSGFDVKLDGRSNLAHYTGIAGSRTGNVPTGQNKSEHPTLDVLIADAIGTDTRFRSLELAATGNPKDTFSWRTSAQQNPSEGSPVAFYQRVFGTEFQDPNAADFRPDPKVMLRKSVLSGVSEERADLARRLGAHDRARLDEYFTSLRQLESQLELQLQKPPPAEACVVPKQPGEKPAGIEIGEVTANHTLMAQLLAISLACNQTKVFNMVYSNTGGLRKAGDSTSHHQLTHEELTDKALGYQPQSAWFTERAMEAFATFLTALSSIREGNGTLLDNTLVYAQTDTNFAKAHSITGLPAMTAGKAGGRLRTGMHIASNGEPITRVGLTLQQVMGLAVSKWGTDSMATGSPLTQLMA